jgi:uncharacterized protein
MSTSSLPEKIVACPCCQGDSLYATRNPYRPFCSERCKKMDFSAWASENYRLQASSSLDDDALVQEKLPGSDASPTSNTPH